MLITLRGSKDQEGHFTQAVRKINISVYVSPAIR